MTYKYKVTFKEGTTSDQIKGMMERIKGSIDGVFDTTLPIYYLETDTWIETIQKESIIETIDLIGLEGATR